MKKLFTLFTATLFSLSMLADVYTVAGQPASLFGTVWDEWNVSNEMTYVDGHYEWTRQNVYIPAGQIQYRIVKDHNWETAWPVSGPRYTNQLAEGVYNITITFTLDTHQPGLIPERVGDYVPSTRTIYCRMTYDWWTVDGAGIAIQGLSGVGIDNYESPGVRMEAMAGENGLWKGELDTRYTRVVFCRVNGSGDIQHWGAETAVLDIPAEDNLFTITNETARWIGEGNACGGVWSMYSADPVTPPVEQGPVYSLAGSKDLLQTTADWNPDDTSTEMTLDSEDGLYKYIVTNVMLAANTDYEFKVLKDHSWGTCYPAGPNEKINVDKDGIYNVTITFNAATGEIGKIVEFVSSAVVEKHYLVVGDPEIANGEYWNIDADVNLMTSDDGGQTYKLVVTGAKLYANTAYGFKIVEKGSWTEYFPKQDGYNAYLTVPEHGIYTLTYIYTVATGEFALDKVKTEDIPAPRLQNGFYLVGTFGGVDAWDVEDLDESKHFQLIEQTETYRVYVVTADLALGDQLKAVWVTNDVITYWLPGNQDPNLEVTTNNYAGEDKIITIYYDIPSDYYYIWIDPNLYTGYYLLGTMNEWTPMREYMFTQNPENDAEYLFTMTLAENDEFKVAYIQDGWWDDDSYFPNNGAGNFVVDANHAGEKTIYFRPDYQGGEDWYYNCIFVPANEGSGLDKIISSGKAAKIMRDGQIRIIKGNKTYNLLGGAAE